jgi:hypothetical protein
MNGYPAAVEMVHYNIEIIWINTWHLPLICGII